MEDRYEAKALEIRLGLQAYDPNNPPAGPIFLQPELHVEPCPVCDKFGHKAVDCPKLCPLCINTGDCNQQVHSGKVIHTMSLLRKIYLNNIN
jgi:hypothetical protein